ncbi:hypothetical protein [Phaeovulum vinaykumarii]|uniref:Uncharacterized protein n=1 Tax=Phaeovulum vinaykumarii TaxID=407234 RepID=A0A1N7M4Y7_9RHOB|nr:hypothetical protein [Phaeovulum vinaykumarii]SIS81154.1 hypothetical protein SAMN05421795_105200 [Phaeovulum vinaykumarii]SOC08644.1 hypothetical protein SAMN05878426_1052 [Phaeovulum vinaykumarii]
MTNERACANTPGLPGETLSEIHDCLALALDATERPSGYTRSEREARSYMRTALRRVCKLLEIRA